LIPLYFLLLWAKRTFGLSAVEIALWDIAERLFAPRAKKAGADVELMLDVDYAWSLTEARRRAEAPKQFRLNGSRGHLATRKL
jgi:L-alanine-DL-glutamate epimerase-like enolase superfamily enzyme